MLPSCIWKYQTLSPRHQSDCSAISAAQGWSGGWFEPLWSGGLWGDRDCAIDCGFMVPSGNSAAVQPSFSNPFTSHYRACCSLTQDRRKHRTGNTNTSKRDHCAKATQTDAPAFAEQTRLCNIMSLGKTQGWYSLNQMAVTLTFCFGIFFFF